MYGTVLRTYVPYLTMGNRVSQPSGNQKVKKDAQNKKKENKGADIIHEIRLIETEKMNVSTKQLFFGTILCVLARCSLSFSSRLYGRTISKDVRDPFCGTRIRKHNCIVMFNSLDDKNSELDSQVMLNFPDSTILDIELEDHKPLGCTAEECLDVLESENGAKHVFISKIVEGGNAEKAGIELGDLIIGVSSIFGDTLENVNGVGLDRV